MKNRKYVWFLLLSILLYTGCAEAYVQETAVTRVQLRKVEDQLVPDNTAEPTPEPTPVPTPTPVYEAVINIVGDLMVHQWQLDEAYNSITDSYDFDHCFDKIRDHLTAADYTVGNLETVLADKELGISDYPMFGAPDAFAYALKNAGFDLLSTANNHCYDKGLAGVLRTVDVLDGLEMAHVGTYKSQEARDTVLIKDINNIRFAFLSYTYGINGMKLPADKPYLVNMLDAEMIKADVERAKALDADVVIVLPHMGEEYRETPGSNDKAWIDVMLAAGADVVAASHPHVLQPMERIKITDQAGVERDCYAAYSLGNFISSQRTLPRDAGVILGLTFRKTEGEAAVLVDAAYTATWVSFINAKGVYDIAVLPVDDTLEAYHNGEDINLRQKDIQRLENVKKAADAMFMNIAVPD